MPNPYAATASAGTIGAYSIASRNFELQQRVTADLHSAICSSLGSITLNEINSKHQFGTGSLTPLDLVTELKAMFGTITKQEIDATQAIISAISAVTYTLTTSSLPPPDTPSQNLHASIPLPGRSNNLPNSTPTLPLGQPLTLSAHAHSAL
jgi:hypothetical protein